jgi:NADH-quinone oxidoreductase subunit C
MPEDRVERPELRRALEALTGPPAGAVLAGAVEGGEISVRVAPGSLVAVLRCLKEDHGFSALEDIAAFDNLGAAGDGGRRFTVVYRLYRSPGALRARVAVDVGEGESLASAVPLFRSADWAEREAFDMFGIRFEGHPDLRRIYLPEEFEGHPLRKDFPLAGRTGGA